MSFVQKVAASEATAILIQGESGTGKDLIAKTIHYDSTLQNGPFVAINCSGIPETLMEPNSSATYAAPSPTPSRGGKACSKPPTTELCFLDEIGELSPLLQAKLLRVLEDQMIRRVGGARDMQVDVRVIAAL